MHAGNRALTKLPALLLGYVLVSSVAAQTEERGPWTAHTLADGVYNIQDYTSTNPRGIHLDAAGNRTGMNNCSDIYLIVGSRRALLIDLSNPHDGEAAGALRALVYSRIGALPLTITATHFHGDHLGMLPAFVDDPRVDFWASAGEFADRAIFPAAKVTWFDAGATLDLGGRLVRSIALPGHTPHSTGFLLSGADLLFTGDALGSGSGVWLFDFDSFLDYRDTIDRLLALLTSRGTGADPDALRIYSGHTWQYGPRTELTLQYVRDMHRLIELMTKGEVPARDYRVDVPFLDATFTFGSATITWNRAAAERLVREARAQ